ncbi:MAG: metal ABC transporter substrate-binding protein [Peptostreptococcaceae bacterium]|nr:metal ABC transporter substrate-binding protein [Peptostreptococcaceae bacterium]
MKKILTLMVAAVVMMGSLGACAQKAETPAQDTQKLSIVTTIFPPFDFARTIGGEKAEVSMLLPPGAESHSFEPSPQDIIKVQEADLFIYNGGDSDAWVDEILESMGENAPATLKMMDAVNLLEEEVVEGMEHDEHDHDHDHDHDADKDKKDDHDHDADKNKEEDHDHDHEGTHTHEGVMDEHVWTSPKNAIKISQAIAEKLAGTDPENATFYMDNFKAYKEKLTALDTQFKEIVEHATLKTMVFGDRFPLRYFANEYGLDYYAAFVGCSTQSDASAATVAFLIDKVKEEKIPTVFFIELSEHKIADAVSEATGSQIAMFHTCHNVTKAELEEGATYLSLMEKNAETLKAALQ